MDNSSTRVSTDFSGLMRLTEALVHINTLSACHAAYSEKVAHLAQSGAVVCAAEDIRAEHPVPPFNNSAVDGFALHADDLDQQQPLRIIGTTTAGQIPAKLSAGCALRIYTGAMLPEACAAVVMHEDTQAADSQHVRLLHRVAPDHHCRKAGEDFADQALIADVGTLLRSHHYAALSASGVSHIRVRPPLRVGILSSGDELRHHDQPIARAMIHDANRLSLIHLFQRQGCQVTDLGIIADDLQTMTRTIDQAQECDLVVASAGMSRSNSDCTARLMQQRTPLFWQLAIKPARPVGVCSLPQGRFLLGLPGNAAACLWAAWIIGLPLVERLQGGQAQLPQATSVRLLQPIRKRCGRREFPRARLIRENGVCYAQPLPASSAGLHLSLKADGVLDLPEEVQVFDHDQSVDFIPFPPHF